MDRRSVIAGIGATGALLALGGFTSATALESRKAQYLLTPDQQLELILSKLESLPQHLKTADPKNYANYEKEIREYLGDTKLITSTPEATKPGTAVPLFNGLACVASLAGFIASTGIPATKIIGWIRKARAIWGGVRGIITAIKSGVAATEIGGEAAEVLLNILDAQDVVTNCFN